MKDGEQGFFFFSSSYAPEIRQLGLQAAFRCFALIKGH